MGKTKGRPYQEIKNNQMTQEEEKEIIRVCGPDYDYWDIPPAIRKRDEDEARALSAQEDEWRQERKVEE